MECLAGKKVPEDGADAQLQQSRFLEAEKMFQGFLSSGDETEDDVMQDDESEDEESEDEVMQEDDSEADDLAMPSRPIVARFLSIDLGTKFIDASRAVKIEQNP